MTSLVNKNILQNTMDSGSCLSTIVILLNFLSTPSKGNGIAYRYHCTVNFHRAQCSHCYVMATIIMSRESFKSHHTHTPVLMLTRVRGDHLYVNHLAYIGLRQNSYEKSRE